MKNYIYGLIVACCLINNAFAGINTAVGAIAGGYIGGSIIADSISNNTNKLIKSNTELNQNELRADLKPILSDLNNDEYLCYLQNYYTCMEAKNNENKCKSWLISQYKNREDQKKDLIFQLTLQTKQCNINKEIEINQIQNKIDNTPGESRYNFLLFIGVLVICCLIFCIYFKLSNIIFNITLFVGGLCLIAMSFNTPYNKNIRAISIKQITLKKHDYCSELLKTDTKYIAVESMLNNLPISKYK